MFVLMIWNLKLKLEVFFYIVFILKLQFGVFYFDIAKFEIKIQGLLWCYETFELWNWWLRSNMDLIFIEVISLNSIWIHYIHPSKSTITCVCRLHHGWGASGLRCAPCYNHFNMRLGFCFQLCNMTYVPSNFGNFNFKFYLLTKYIQPICKSKCQMFHHIC
jgi:hypothetical protein